MLSRHAGVYRDGDRFALKNAASGRNPQMAVWAGIDTSLLILRERRSQSLGDEKPARLSEPGAISNGAYYRGGDHFRRGTHQRPRTTACGMCSHIPMCFEF